MRKRLWTGCAAFLMAVMLLGGCATSKQAGEATTAVDDDNTAKSYASMLNEDGTLNLKASDYVSIYKYKKMTIPKEEISVSSEEVDSRVDTLVSEYAMTKQVTDRKVKDGDTVNIDYKGTIDGKQFAGGTAEGIDLIIGSHSFIGTFEDQLIGKKPGDTVKVEVTFPSDYAGRDVAGKDAVFETKINYISVTKKPELTDKFVKEKFSKEYGYKSVKDMKKKIKSSIRKENKKNYMLREMLDRSTFKEIPEELTDYVTEGTVTEMKYSAAMNDISWSDYLNASGMADEEALRESLRESCEKTAKLFLIADVVAEKEKISVTDKDVEDYLGKTDLTDYVEHYSMPYLKRQTLNNRVFEHMLKKVKVEE